MTTKCDQEKACDDHKKTFLTVCGFYCTVMIILIGYMVSNDSRARASENDINNRLSEAELTNAHQHQEMMSGVRQQMSDGFSEIRQRLARIEASVK
jgi:hypothetical protein